MKYIESGSCLGIRSRKYRQAVRPQKEVCKLDKKKLRSGFTTGACAAAAAKAAVSTLLSGRTANSVSLTLPGKKTAVFSVTAVERSHLFALCGVRKDAGDDPDITNGTLIFAKVSRNIEQKDGSSWDKPFYHSEKYPFLLLTGGEGIGIVTKSGLLCPVGFPAINPAPREMIFEAAAKEVFALKNGKTENLIIEISIQDGAGLAEKTFNPRLGIVGGLSVLGTTGIVNPMSEEALVETIRLEIRVKVEEGKKILAVAPGNYGERFLEETLGISMEYFIKCSNFIGETFHMIKQERIEKVLLAGHIGKLIKVAGGILNTHSRYGDRRMEVFYDCAKEAGVLPPDRYRILEMNTTEEAVAFLKETEFFDKVAEIIVKRIQETLYAHSGILAEVVVFSNVHGVLCATKGVRKFVEYLTYGTKEK